MEIESKYRLKADVYMEPLVNRWYAVPFLIAPVTSALLAAGSQVKIMESYISDPSVHEAALQFTEMRGGPFIDLASHYLEQIKYLLAITKENLSYSLQFAEAIKTLVLLVKHEAQGYTLEHIYSKIPNILKGYLELTYDSLHQPSFRFFESLLYTTPLYLENFQSVSLFQGRADDRSFALTTPRIPKKDEFNISLPFADPFYDKFFAKRWIPSTKKQINELFDMIPSNNLSYDYFFNFFCQTSILQETQNEIDTFRIRYFGHACLLIESPEISIMVDPMLGYHFNGCSPRYSYADLPKTIDYLLLTHQHQDHVLIEHLLQLRSRVKTVILPRNNSGAILDPSLKLILQHIGYQNILVLDEFDTVPFLSGYITAIPFLGEHGDLAIYSKLSYLISIQEKSLLIAADSNVLDDEIYNHIRSVVGNIDTLFISMECEGASLNWLYGALLSEPLPREKALSRKLTASNAQRVFRIAQALKCRRVYIYAMGEEAWLSHIMKPNEDPNSLAKQEIKTFMELSKSAGLYCEQLYGQREIYL